MQLKQLTNLSVKNTQKSCTYIKSNFRYGIIAILFNYALRFLYKTFLCFRCPPINQIAVLVELSSLIVKTVRNFMTNYKTDCTVIHIFWPVVVEEHSLQDTRWEFCKFHNTNHLNTHSHKKLRTNTVLDGRIESIDDCGPSVCDPISFVNGLSETFEGKLCSEKC